MEEVEYYHSTHDKIKFEGVEFANLQVQCNGPNLNTAARKNVMSASRCNLNIEYQ